MEEVNDIVRQQAEGALSKLGALDLATPEYVADCIVRRTAYWQKEMPDGRKLLFVRFSSPVVQREEVFLGSILLNAFLSKAFTRAVADDGLGNAELVANDLENYYFLGHTTSELKQMKDRFLSEVERCLPDLFFGEQDQSKGIYGDLHRMFTFRKSEFEPFPVYAVPEFLAPVLERAVRGELCKLLAPTAFPECVRTVLATIAFFYGRTSGGRGDAQSPSNFIHHLVNEKDYDGLLRSADVKRAFNIATVNKSAIKQSIDDGTYSMQELRRLLSNLVEEFQASLDGSSTKWLMAFLRKDKKFMDLSAQIYMDHILPYAWIGFLSLSRGGYNGERELRCTICGSFVSRAKSSMSLMGVHAFDRHNQSVRQPEKESPRVCARCALCSYLGQRLLGTEPHSIGGRPPKYAQVPKAHNLLFHYGKHDEQEVGRLTRAIDLTWDLLHQNRKLIEIRRQLSDLEGKVQKETRPDKQRDLNGQVVQKQNEVQIAQATARNTGRELFDSCPWLRDWDGLEAPYETPSLDVLSHLQPSETKVERHVLDLGMSGYRMILFVLPQIQPPPGKAHDFAQHRFSDSRVTVTALLSFLRQLCGCDGPFYYQSLPTLAAEAFQRDTFYISNESISVQTAQNEYEAVTQLAWRLVKKRGSGEFVEKVVLAEKLLEDPLGTFAAVMRSSAILGQTKSTYKRLRAPHRSDWGARDLTKYGQFIQRLSKLQEVSEMALQLDRQDVDELCPRLFRTLDDLGLLPQLWAKPTEFEKHARLLFGSIGRYNDVEAGFKEWESRVLREAPYRKEECYPALEALRRWMIDHAALFSSKVNLQHLRTSLYARVFQYLYPRRVLANAYCKRHQGKADVVKKFNQFLTAKKVEDKKSAQAELELLLNITLPATILDCVQKVREVYSDEWETIVADAKASLIANGAYYRTRLRGEEAPAPPEEMEQAETEETEEEME